MTDVDALLDDWAAVGLSEVTLPSGYQVRLRLPEPKDLIVRGLLPPSLVVEVLAHESVEAAVKDPDLAARMAQALRTLAADTIRQARRSVDEPWHPVTVTPERFDMLPDADKEMVQELAASTLSAAEANDVGADPDTAARTAREEAAGTVDAYAEFRDRTDGPARGQRRTDVRPAPVEPDRAAAAPRRAADRPRSGRASRKG